MKKTHLLLLAPLLLLFLMAYTQPRPFVAPAKYKAVEDLPLKKARPVAAQPQHRPAKQLLAYANTLLGTPYTYTGITPESGFDCSGFVTHVFDTQGMDVPHSSALQAEEGTPVTRAEAQPGDLVIFTGTDESIRKPGHVGIILSAPGDTISFIHASSNGGVKISKVEGTRYNDRFLEIRRVL